MIQRAGSPDDRASEIARRIAQAARPWRIVLFGSRARGNPTPDSDYDIFVEVDADPAALKAIDLELRRLFSDSGWALDLKVRRSGEIERRRHDPGTIEWDVAREGKVLYADPAASTILMPPGRVGEPPRDPPDSMYEWLETAERDLRHCHRLRGAEEDFSPEICWLSHQSSEKYMKALLIARHVRPARTHSLSELLEALRSAGCELPNLDDACILLTTHAIIPRYPAGLDLGEEDARAAFAAAERVVTAVRAHLPPRLH